MVWYDFVILAILAYGAWQGAARGLIMQLAWIVAIVLCFKFADKLAPQIESQIGVEQPLRHYIAMLILYLGFSLGSFFVARSLSQAIEKAKFQDFDRHLGGLFGLLKGAVLSLVITFFAVTLSESLRETVARSKTGLAACAILDTIKPLTPEDAHPLIHDTLAKYQNALDVHDEHIGQPTSVDDFYPDDVGDPGRGQITNDQSRRPVSSGRDLWGGVSYEEFLGVLTPSIRDRVSDSLKRTWNNLSTTAQDELATDLKLASPSEVEATLRHLYSLTSGQGSGPIPPVESRLVNEIADTYGDPQGTRISINQHLTGVPAEVQHAVLEDWYADLTMSDRDPDPRTHINTRLDDRILNQLSRRRVSIDTLALDLRNRLQRSQ